ncbi:hypothetical protein [Photorhabdus sp. CRCIA-P01]|uniref:hypothetical protein n=1 Tax=Photorhabdus sp. CRCIA-P01 TaxID=2019570 RepID=UPI001300329F|nr:hypothetical protein [Photorhabdus sp. CRCIA-P01]
MPSKTIWKRVGKERIDVENPNPDQRAGQLHNLSIKKIMGLYILMTIVFLQA